MSKVATDLNLGSYIKVNGNIYKLISKNHVKPGKGGAYIQVVLKGIKDGSKLEHRFSSSDTVETIRVERKKFQFSYFEKQNVVLIDLDTYETIEVSEGMISENSMYLLKKFSQEDSQLDVEFVEEQIFDVIFVGNTKVTVDTADAIVKGQTAASSYKNAIIKDDITIAVPAYVNSGDEIIINLYGEKGIEFVSRA